MKWQNENTVRSVIIKPHQFVMGTRADNSEPNMSLKRPPTPSTTLTSGWIWTPLLSPSFQFSLPLSLRLYPSSPRASSEPTIPPHTEVSLYFVPQPCCSTLLFLLFLLLCLVMTCSIYQLFHEPRLSIQKILNKIK